MADRQGICRLYAKDKKCRFGNTCRFLHATSSNATSTASTHRRAASVSSPSTPSSDTRARNGTHSTPSRPGATTNTPNGVCRVYWGTGTCERLFDCSFKHVKGSVAAASTSSQPEVVDDETPDFFSAEGLVINSGATRSKRLALDPSEAHNHIKPFLKDNYHFESVSKMLGLVNVLASVNDSNKSWVCFSLCLHSVS